jgi:hypothetical protein
MQKQKLQIEKQDSLIAVLSNQINSCCSKNGDNKKVDNNTGREVKQQNIELSDKEAIVLEKNVPNPFAEQTTISYNLPAKIVKAQIIFYNSIGQIIQTVELKTRGAGQINVFASDLSSGLYHDALVADSKVIDSKKMVRDRIKA